jgi:uncharacterized membrane protein
MRRWVLLVVLVLAEIGYPLVSGPTRAALVVVTVVVGFAAVVAHALTTRGVLTAAALLVTTTGGGFAVEALGVATGVPFGDYAYGDALGPRLLGVPLVIALAWTWMAWPAWLAAGTVVRPAWLAAGTVVRPLAGRVLLAGLGLAAWDLFLDPQMVAERYWQWRQPHPSLPGIPDVPVSNYLGWFGVAVALMALLGIAGAAAERAEPTLAGAPGGTAGAAAEPAEPTLAGAPGGTAGAAAEPAEPTLAGAPGATAGGPAARAMAGARDAPMLALYLWTYGSSVLAHAVFLGLPASAGWGALGLGLVALPLAWRLLPRRRVPALR